ncbi:hypothetical protein [uncultured Chryseobacterium sp.]|uniref:hypothetical protein n=1 Tax=uncultured Chryseobacterium sp. TaxID=259322 RepID=UPI0025D8A59A|nr:hypothetical protein [uncultured Chryseobacterium sp.]
MKIEIKTPAEKFTLEFENEEAFRKIHDEITEALTDDMNVRGVFYDKGDISMMFPALLLKNSIITIYKETSADPSL